MLQLFYFLFFFVIINPETVGSPKPGYIVKRKDNENGNTQVPREMLQEENKYSKILHNFTKTPVGFCCCCFICLFFFGFTTRNKTGKREI